MTSFVSPPLIVFYSPDGHVIVSTRTSTPLRRNKDSEEREPFFFLYVLFRFFRVWGLSGEPLAPLLLDSVFFYKGAVAERSDWLAATPVPSNALM